MLQPAVREKMRQNASKPMREATKAKIKKSLLTYNATRRKTKAYQLACLEDWKDQVSNAARIGVAGEEELPWNSFSELKMKSKLEYARELRAFQRVKKRGFQELVGHSKDHRKRISKAMQEKWKDQDYRTRVSMGIRSHMLTHSSRSNSEKRLTVKRSKTNHRSTTKVASENQQNGNGLSANKVFSQEVSKNVDRQALATEMMMGEALLISSKTRTGVNGHFRKALGSCVVDDNLLLMPEEPIFDGKDGEASATGLAVNLFSCNAQDSKPEIPSILKGRMYVDSKALEKLEKLRRLQASRLIMEMKKKEAAERACMLMLEAEKAAKVLEDAAKSNKFARASLAETRRLLAEAAQSMKTVEAKNFNILSPMQHEKTSWYATERTTERTKTSALPATKTSCNFSDACHKSAHQSVKNNAQLDPKMLSGSNGPSDIFDLIDSWIINEDFEKVRTSPLTRIGKFHKPRKISWVQPGLGTTGSNIKNSTNVDKESLTFTLRCQNMNYVSSISAIGSLGKNNCVDVNWTISNQAKGLKRWHSGRLVNVENEEFC
ncbi:hypothetical protein O6H91_Y462500 [Diphasiastrum complanatum]|nr:hypothetical protein O6H91_Y462500 [Diphasiastrum complanatum]